MPALPPTRTLDALDFIVRHPVQNRRAGWEVVVEFGGQTHRKRFADRGDAPAALARAMAWRDETVNRVNSQAGQSLGPQTSRTKLGILVTTTTVDGTEHEIVTAQLPAIAAFKKQRITRAVKKYGLDDAVAQAARFRYDGMRDRYGDAYPFESATALAQAVLDAHASGD